MSKQSKEPVSKDPHGYLTTILQWLSLLFVNLGFIYAIIATTFASMFNSSHPDETQNKIKNEKSKTIKMSKPRLLDEANLQNKNASFLQNLKPARRAGTKRIKQPRKHNTLTTPGCIAVSLISFFSPFCAAITLLAYAIGYLYELITKLTHPGIAQNKNKTIKMSKPNAFVEEHLTKHDSLLDDAKLIFDFLDADGSASLSIDEFVAGASSALGRPIPRALLAPYFDPRHFTDDRHLGVVSFDVFEAICVENFA